MPSIGVKLYSVFFKLMLKHRLQSRLQSPENDAVGGSSSSSSSFGVTSRPDEETPVASNPSFTDGVATKDIHIDPLTSLNIRIFLPDTCLHIPETLPKLRAFGSGSDQNSRSIYRRNSSGSFNSESNNNSTGVVGGTVGNIHRRNSYAGIIEDPSLKNESGSYRGYNPVGTNCRRLPVMLQFHGGGFVSGSNDSAANDFFCRRIAKLCDVIVLAVGYRLAPENRYPAAFEDGLKVLHWLVKQANLAECSKSLGGLKGADLRRSEGNWHMADAFGASMVEPWLAAHGDPSRKNLQLLATCYLQNNQAYCAHHILKGTQMAQSRYLFALSCFQMDLMNEAEAALSPNESSPEIPNGASGHYLLGLVCRYTDRRQSAINHFNQALSLDPLLWAAYEELCILGAAGEATSVFDEGVSMCIQKQYLDHGLALQTSRSESEDHGSVSNRISSSEDLSPRKLKHVHENTLWETSGSKHGTIPSQYVNGGSTSFSFCSTPSPVNAQTTLSGVAPPPVFRNGQVNRPNMRPHGADNSPRVTLNSTIAGPRRKFVDEVKLRKVSEKLFPDSGQRRSLRLAGESAVNSSTSTASGNGTTKLSRNVGSSKSSTVTSRSVAVRKGHSLASVIADEGICRDVCDDSRLNSTSSSSSPLGDSGCLVHEGMAGSSGEVVLDSSKVRDGASALLGLLRLLGEGFRLSCLCRCQDALDIYVKLPQKHYNTGWVLSQVGKAHFERIDYLEADRAFSLARIASPYSMDGMDVYSTVLYHLKEDMKLSYLAQELVSTDRLAPQSWCAMGNCYSLQKDHETALKNFQRAVQIDSRFSYAHTLCGHEYVALEDFENGIKSYQSALHIDSRHYNAWYGLGMIYLRQEKFEFSEHHFRIASHINPHSSVIMSYLGTALHALKRNNEALEMMERAVSADRKNPLPLYQKANILVSMDDLDGALAVLEELKEYAPRESSVYALMGNIYKRKAMYDEAMLHFGSALDLKPSATDVAAIKAAIEKLNVPDEIDDMCESIE